MVKGKHFYEITYRNELMHGTIPIGDKSWFLPKQECGFDFTIILLHIFAYSWLPAENKSKAFLKSMSYILDLKRFKAQPRMNVRLQHYNKE